VLWLYVQQAASSVASTLRSDRRSAVGFGPANAVPGCSEQFKITLYHHLNRGQNPELKCKLHMYEALGQKVHTQESVGALIAATGAKLLSVYKGVHVPLVIECAAPDCSAQFTIALNEHLNAGQNPELKCLSHRQSAKYYATYMRAYRARKKAS
jgi:hypothetical protein